MQTLSGQGSPNSLNAQSRSIAVIALILFAVAGLLSGLAISAFIRPAQQQLASNTSNTLTLPKQSQVHTPTAIIYTHPIPIGYPVIDHVSYSGVADGRTVYTVSAHAVDQSIDAAHGKPLHASGITCKLWLTKDGNVNANTPLSRLKAIDTLAQPFPKEVQEGLNFDAATPQTQLCNSNGQGKWNYTFSSSLKHSTYYLVVLMDWAGMHFNWSWVQVDLQKSN